SFDYRTRSQLVDPDRWLGVTNERKYVPIPTVGLSDGVYDMYLSFPKFPYTRFDEDEGCGIAPSSYAQEVAACLKDDDFGFDLTECEQPPSLYLFGDEVGQTFEGAYEYTSS